VFAIIPGAVLWGASFPLALAAARDDRGADSNPDAGRTVGRVFAANTLVAIVGSLITGLVLVPWIGTKGAQQVFIVLVGGERPGGDVAETAKSLPARLVECFHGRLQYSLRRRWPRFRGTDRMGPLAVMARCSQRACTGRRHETLDRRD